MAQIVCKTNKNLNFNLISSFKANLSALAGLAGLAGGGGNLGAYISLN